jgi:hypothetical protein
VFAAVSMVAVIQPVPVLATGGVGVSCAWSSTAFNGTIWPRSSPPPKLSVWMFA